MDNLKMINIENIVKLEYELHAKMDQEYRLLKSFIDSKYNSQLKALMILRQQEEKRLDDERKHWEIQSKIEQKQAMRNEIPIIIRHITELLKFWPDNADKIDFGLLKKYYQKLVKITEYTGCLTNDDEKLIVPHNLKLNDLGFFLRNSGFAINVIRFTYEMKSYAIGLYAKNVTCVHKAILRYSNLFNDPVRVFRDKNPHKTYTCFDSRKLNHNEGYYLYFLKNVSDDLYFDGYCLMRKNHIKPEINFNENSKDKDTCYVCKKKFSFWQHNLSIDYNNTKINVHNDTACYNQLGIMWIPDKYNSDYLLKS